MFSLQLLDPLWYHALVLAVFLQQMLKFPRVCGSLVKVSKSEDSGVKFV